MAGSTANGGIHGGIARLAAAVACLAGGAWLVAANAQAQKDHGAEREDYVRAPMPAGFQVVPTDFDGPVFADADGKTLYTWPSHSLRNGDAGELRDKPACDDHVYTVNSGLMSPYPPGLELPDADHRPSCTQLWPPVLAAADAKPVGKWSIVKRPDGRMQWAYDGFAVYTSVLDRQPGDVFGGDRLKHRGDSPAVRQPIGPTPNVPSQFSVVQTMLGRLLTADDDFSVYTSDRDAPNKSNCDTACLHDWSPVLAPQLAVTTGEWSVIERAPGIKQWAFRKKPLYTRIGEEKVRSLEGSDVPGWHNVYTQSAPPLPKGLVAHDTEAGQVVADAHGKTVYIYHCGDDALDQLACDNPASPQEYRFAVCGGGDPATCLRAFPYVTADTNAKSDSRIWSVMDIDPATGHFAKPGQANALHVWAFRGRPVFTFAPDKPGETNADGWGEFNGWRNGFKAFFLRDDFRDNTE